MNDYKVGDQVFFRASAKRRTYLPVVVREINEKTQSVVGAMLGDNGEDLALFEWPMKNVFTKLPNGGKQ